MKKSILLIVIALCCTSIMSNAQKRAVYVISPLHISYQEIVGKNQVIHHKAFDEPTITNTGEKQEARRIENEQRHKQAEEKQKASEEELSKKSAKPIIPEDAFRNIDEVDVIEPVKMTNDCYIAFLIKNKIFKLSKDRSLLDMLCDSSHIQKIVNKYDVKTLKECGKYHDKRLNTYAK